MRLISLGMTDSGIYNPVVENEDGTITVYTKISPDSSITLEGFTKSRPLPSVIKDRMAYEKSQEFLVEEDIVELGSEEELMETLRKAS